MALQTEKIICGLITHLVADTDTDTDTDENCFGIHFSLQMQTQLVFAV